ncbi:MAG TPA: hypothetical protein PLD20_05640 [Blastocatellia bacterium]|nr:hypothetical protein [Blastocatellia bacterium]HMX27932.1 hypothetical protein [Blastocatellia bacterium]HMZ17389.1 hypothetical protein [Blastocatellia bacterium]HNG29239.1 hypothetical protein [Blastocatellia bacterium]
MKKENANNEIRDEASVVTRISALFEKHGVTEEEIRFVLEEAKKQALAKRNADLGLIGLIVSVAFAAAWQSNNR